MDDYGRIGSLLWGIAFALCQREGVFLFRSGAISSTTYAMIWFRTILVMIDLKPVELTEYNDELARRIIEQITVMSEDRMSIQFKGSLQVQLKK